LTRRPFDSAPSVPAGATLSGDRSHRRPFARPFSTSHYAVCPRRAEARAITAIWPPQIT
jgi:hypothetical protein